MVPLLTTGPAQPVGAVLIVAPALVCDVAQGRN